jgi:hypothetical protein
MRPGRTKFFAQTFYLDETDAWLLKIAILASLQNENIKDSYSLLGTINELGGAEQQASCRWKSRGLGGVNLQLALRREEEPNYMVERSKEVLPACKTSRWQKYLEDKLARGEMPTQCKEKGSRLLLRQEGGGRRLLGLRRQ